MTHMKNVDRIGIAVTPKEKFKIWLASVTPHPITDDFKDNNIYLLNGDLAIHELDQWLRNNYARIFECELIDRLADKSAWPEKYTLALFNEWFEVRYSGVVYDLETSALTTY